MLRERAKTRTDLEKVVQMLPAHLGSLRLRVAGARTEVTIPNDTHRSLYSQIQSLFDRK